MAKVKPRPVIDLNDVGAYVWIKINGEIKKTCVGDIRIEKKMDIVSGTEGIKYKLTLCQC